MSYLTFRAKLTMKLQETIYVGRPFFNATYILEVNYPLIFIIHMVLIGFYSVTKSDIYATKLDAAPEKALEIMEVARKQLTGEVTYIGDKVSMKQAYHGRKSEVLHNIIQTINGNKENYRLVLRIFDNASMNSGVETLQDNSE